MRKKKLEVNVDKTKIMVFKKRKRKNEESEWKWEESKIKRVKRVQVVLRVHLQRSHGQGRHKPHILFYFFIIESYSKN
jgi:hypothetical protein